MPESAYRSNPAWNDGTIAALRLAFKSVTQSFLLLDADLTVVGCSADLDAVVRPGDRAISLVGPEQADRARTLLTRVLETGSEESFSWEQPTSSGRRSWSAHLRPWTLGAIEAVFATVRDRTAELEEASRLEELEDQLRQDMKLRALGALTSSVAHDFNTFTTVIGMYGEFALDCLQLSHPARVEVQQVLSASEKATALTRQLLSFCRREPSTSGALDLEEVVRAFAPMLQRLLSARWPLCLDVDSSVPTVVADRGSVETALLNLVVNGRDATPEGGPITIRLRGPEVEGEAALVCLTVEDCGVGMTEDVVEQAFDPFFTTKPAGRGTGLGLAWVRRAIEEDGGRVRVESAPGRGTAVVLHYPVDGSAPGPAPTAQPRMRPQEGCSVVLIVDDDVQVRGLIRRVLTNVGYETRLASSGPEALQVLASSGDSIALMVSDVVMPGMGGAELCATALAQRPGLPILFLSALDVRDEAGGYGGYPFLQKPFRPAELVAEVARLIAASGLVD